MSYSLDYFSPNKFYALKSRRLLEARYYEILDIEGKIVDEMYNKLPPIHKAYVSNLIHEGRSSAHTAISTIMNVEWYEENHPEQGKEMRRKMYHYLLLFSIYMQSLVFFYNIWKGE